MSFTAEAYYEGGHRDQPVMVRSPDDVDRLIDALLAAPFTNSMANLYIAERPRQANGLVDHELGVAVNAETGLGGLWYLDSANGAWYSLGSRSDRDEVFYCFVGNDREFPTDSEIPVDLLRQAVKEFLATGGQRPTVVRWQPTNTSAA